MTEADRPRALILKLGAAFSIYLYFAGFCLGTEVSQIRTESISNIALTFMIAPFMGLPAALGMTYAWVEQPQSHLGTVFLLALLAGGYLTASRGRGLRSWLLRLFPLYAYALGFLVQSVLVTYFGVHPPPLSF